MFRKLLSLCSENTKTKITTPTNVENTLGNHAKFMIDSKGEIATTYVDGKRESLRIHSPVAHIARSFIDQNSKPDCKIYGHVGFNYAAHIRDQTYNPGEWPLLSLMIPRTEITIHRDCIAVVGDDDNIMREIRELIDSCIVLDTPPPNFKIEENAGNYTTQVAAAISEIAEGKYTKVILSRAIDIKPKINMQATLLHGRRGNIPARTFSLNHSGFQATGFSPELVVLVENGKVITEPLAGTRSHKGTEVEVKKLRKELLSDPKEIVEHIISVKEAIRELKEVCQPNTVVVEDLMNIRERGSVQHLGSRVCGSLSSENDAWDVFNILFPAITASGIPKNAALEAIQRIETRPRELYSGAVLLLDGTRFFEATLVLRTVFQDKKRGWIQAGAGIIELSDPERELIETEEKLASIAPFLVAKDIDTSI